MGRSTHKHISKTFILVWMLLGLLLSVIAVQFRLSGSVNLNHFYDVGPKYTVMYGNYTQSYEGLEYGSDAQYHVTTNDCGMHIVISDKKNRHWNFLYLDIRNLSTEKMTLQIISYKYNGTVVYETVTEVREGMNEIPLGSKKSASTALRIINQQGTSFRIQSMQFRKNYSYYRTKKVILMLTVCMVAYLLVFGLLYIICLRYFQWNRIYKCMDWLVKGYDGVVNFFLKNSGKFDKKFYGRIRRVCFFILILNMFITEDYGAYSKRNYYYVYLLIDCIILLLIAAVSVEKEHRVVQWKNPLVLSFMIYSIMTCISDVIVPKKQMFTGEMFLLVFGFLYFVIARMKRPIYFLYDFIKAVEYSYVLSTIVCLVCRPIEKMMEGRYIGMTIGPYSYSAYLVVVIAILLSELDRCMLEKRKAFHLLIYLIGLISAYYFIWLTQSRAGLLAAGFCFFYFLVHVFRMRKGGQYGLRTIWTFLLSIILVVPVLWIQDTALHNLADKLGTTLYFPNDYWMIGAPETGKSQQEIPDDILMKDEYQSLFWGNYVYAEEMDTTSSRFLKKFPSLDILSSGRITIYKEYIGHLNLWGHKKDLSVGGMKYRAHNAILQIGYRYGIFAIIPYTIMILYVIYYGVYYLKVYFGKRKRYAVLPILLIIGCMILMMLDNIERNFRYLPWITFYLLVGFLSNTTETQISIKEI